LGAARYKHTILIRARGALISSVCPLRQAQGTEFP